MLASACLTTLLLTASAACLTVCFVVSSWLAAASRGGPAQSALPPSQQPTEPAFEFEVYDDVLNATTLRALVDAVGAEKPDGVYFDLRSPQMTPLEAALACVLREAGDEMPIVEYWHRADARSINVHRDTDEAEYEDATSGVQQRCPAYAHVLYLSLSPGLRAPTVLWEEEGRGAQAAGERRGGPLSAALRSLTAVPAVEGRLLRFQGDVAHDVPYPPLEYFDAEQEAATGGVLRWASHALERWRGAADRGARAHCRPGSGSGGRCGVERCSEAHSPLLIPLGPPCLARSPAAAKARRAPQLDARQSVPGPPGVPGG